jgi:predicted dehydrogenase
MVGLGWFGRVHLDAWRQVPQAQIVAVCDVDEQAFSTNIIHAQDAFHETAEGAHGTSLDGVERYSDLGRMLREAAPDLVDICVPESAHAEVARAVLSAGVSVVVEKPFTTSAADARSLALQAQSAGLRIFVGNVLRFDPRYVHAVEDLGLRRSPPRHISLQRHFQRSALDVYGRVHPFFGACIHDIDIALWTHGAKPARVLGKVVRGLDGVTCNAAIATLEWADGATAVIQNAWLLPPSAPAGFSFESSFFADASTVTIRSQPVVEVIGPDASRWPEFFFWPSINGVRGGAIVEELGHFASCEQDRRASDRIPVEQACWGIEVAERLVQSACDNAWVDV